MNNCQKVIYYIFETSEDHLQYYNQQADSADPLQMGMQLEINIRNTEKGLIT